MAQYKLNSLEAQVLKATECGGLNSLDLYGKIAPSTAYLNLASFVTDTLAVMAEQGVMLFRDGVWSHGPGAFTALSWLGELARAEQIKGKLTVATGRYSPPTDHYSGAELQTTCLRKGAYDYLGKPSRIGNEFVNHRTAHLAVI